MVLGEEVSELVGNPGVFVRYFDEVFIPTDELQAMERDGKVRNSRSRTHGSL